jgi:5-methyltetrahydrofolate--homocysteine methyltransferase
MEHNEISTALQNGDEKRVSTLTKDALLQNISPEDILNNSLLHGMAVVGERFREHEIFLPHVLLAAKAMYSGMEILKPHFIKEGIPTLGNVILGTVQGDLHDIGKNLVGIMLKGAGYNVIDLGKDVSVMQFVESAEREKADVIGLSALLTTTQPIMGEVIENLRKRDIAIKTIVGGAPLTEKYAGEIGADAYAYDASNAVVKIGELVSNP